MYGNLSRVAIGEGWQPGVRLHEVGTEGSNHAIVAVTVATNDSEPVPA